MLQRRTLLAALILVLGLVAVSSQRTLAEEPGSRVGSAVLSADRSTLSWQPEAAYSEAVLVVSGPTGQNREVFPAGKKPEFSPRADGQYSYELRLAPVIDAETRAKMAAATDPAEREALAAELRAAGLLGEPVVLSGSFLVRNGQIVPATTEPGQSSASEPASGNEPMAPDAQVINDDLVVIGSTCIGFDCTAGEVFSFDTLRLKENNLRIAFVDTSASSAFPTTDWELTANDSADGGQDRFSIKDVTADRIPFTVRGGAPNHSLYVYQNGNIGLGTSLPILDLHLLTGNTPALRLEQDNSGGWGVQTWDIAGNEANFFIRDVTNGSRLPFRIRPGAPTSSIDIAASGNVGIGTAAPAAKLHVNGNILVEGAVTEFSDRDAKAGFQPVDGASVLKLVAELPISTWHYRNDPAGLRHMGPVAQDFYAAFGLGVDERHISPLDANGVSLAAIQELNRIVESQAAEIETLEAENAELEARLQALEAAVQQLIEEK